MRTYILVFDDTHSLDQVREGVRIAVDDVADVRVEREWEQSGDPGGFVALSAPDADSLRDALADVELKVEGMAELAQAEGAVSLPQLSVHRQHLIENAFEYVDYEGPPFEWCDRCTTAHARGRHVGCQGE